jgi:hypothetical protein
VFSSEVGGISSPICAKADFPCFSIMFDRISRCFAASSASLVFLSPCLASRLFYIKVS